VSDIGALRGNGYSDLDDAGRIGSFLNLKSPRVIAANSHAGIEAAIRLGARAERMRYLPNVVDTDEFSPRDSMRGAGVCLLAAGRLVREKRVDRFLNLLARVRAEGGPGITGLVAGSGPLREELLVHAQRAGLYPEAIEFRDLAPPQMKTAYWDADVLVVTSESEGTPNVILEGMSAALPAIATDVGGVSEVVLEGRTGYVVPNYDEDLMVSRVIALAQDRTKRCEMGWNGRTFIEESRALKRLPEILGHLYSSVAH
jgi:glycosyltransferase involved in cell wall biosynthesis